MKRPSLTTALTVTASAVALSVPFLVFADDTFVSLTSLPGINSLIGSPSLPSFVNNLYRLCIGAAALFAFVEIVWAGYLFMTSSDSISKNTKARQKIMNAVIGLVLVLSPYIVFSIIDPKILDLSLDFTKLQSNNGSGADTEFGAFDTSGNTRVVSVDSTSSRTDAEAACTKQGGTSTYQCKAGTANPYSASKDQACKAGEQNITTCSKVVNTDPTACTTTDSPTVIAANGNNEYASEGYAKVKDSCCKGMTAGNTCWQKTQ